MSLVKIQIQVGKQEYSYLLPPHLVATAQQELGPVILEIGRLFSHIRENDEPSPREVVLRSILPEFTKALALRGSLSRETLQSGANILRAFSEEQRIHALAGHLINWIYIIQPAKPTQQILDATSAALKSFSEKERFAAFYSFAAYVELSHNRKEVVTPQLITEMTSQILDNLEDIAPGDSRICALMYDFPNRMAKRSKEILSERRQNKP